ncbi:hypothetical protein ACLX1H_010960 [Fusarium chlamydosporum]
MSSQHTPSSEAVTSEPKIQKKDSKRAKTWDDANLAKKRKTSKKVVFHDDTKVSNNTEDLESGKALQNSNQGFDDDDMAQAKRLTEEAGKNIEI